MLDKLLGRASLKEQIAELETENERLQSRYEAESERRSEAVTARQEAQERQNRLEDRIAQLEGELDRVDTGEDGLDVRARERLRGDRLRAVLDRLESFRTGPEGALTAMIDDGDIPEAVTDILGERAPLVAEAAPCLVCVDDAELISVTLKPPLMPTVDAGWDDQFQLDRQWFCPTGRHVLALVRTDLFALGVYEGSEQTEFRGFESNVKGNHSKGGFSQARFERIRDDQIDDHLDRCLDVLDTYEDDRLILVGQQGVVETVAESVDVAATAAVDATGDPDEALDDAVHSFWTTEMRIL